ncbi:peptidase U32 family protein [Oceanivirga miroungae]|uniref:Peptidase U32 n=1 Tax=Oceanivirga miroungae TaxID=1130046 RepID=A0A6I8MD93_9FUSO|nr:U32 family peptidase [Oceanivirga miroungae]VWL85410.1 peptidase U32 [Oceanivirga miroungae]
MDIVGPAGNYEKLKAAIKAGANEVYMGLKGFGARRNNDNLGYEEIFEGIDYAHTRGVKCLLTLNTVMKDIELKNAINAFMPIYEHGIDAVIIQDLGMISVLKKNFPDLVLHGSTQMTVANSDEANYMKSLGLKRVVLARELSFEEIKTIRENTDIELEVFVSGAMCISYSGNCYVSSFIGGRSGNRGMCAYTCRKKFKEDNNELKYTLSPNDQLLKKEEIEKLKSIGINSIKVEGRKKNPNYVFETVSYYRDVLDGIEHESMSYKLFNRGYSKGYFYLDNKLMNTKYSSNFGYLIGKNKEGKITLLDELENGDGVQFVDENFETIEGIFVNRIMLNNKKVAIAKKGDEIELNMPKNTKYVYKNYSKKINDILDNQRKIVKRYLDINAKLIVMKNEKLSLEYSYKNISAKIEYDVVKEASKKPITKEMLESKISELGDTSFNVKNADIVYDGISFVSFSELKKLKRECQELLHEKIIDSYKREKVLVNYNEYDKTASKKEYIISALVENEEQKRACIDFGIEKIYEAGYDISKQKNIDRKEITDTKNLAYNFKQLLDGKKKNIKQSVNWNFNIFNNYAVDAFSSFPNIDTIFLSPELSYKQIRRITTNSNKKGLVIYGYLKAMYIEHPLITKDYMEIQGEFYDRYRLRKNSLDNIELYLYKPMNLIPKLDLIEELGLDELRLDFTFETYDEVIKILKSIKNRSGKYNGYSFDMGVS